jgi:protein gp37
MGIDSPIQWCDSTVNAQMGCDGCELASRGGSGTCYAETLTARYAGKSKGYPVDFYTPKIFPGRIEAACKWADLAGTERIEKPWLSGLPRHIFLDDMGDTFTESLSLGWLAKYVPAMAASPHVWMILTKRPARMSKFWNSYGTVPENFILMTSITGRVNLSRVTDLLTIRDAMLGVSYEPALGGVDFGPYLRAGLRRLRWLIIGGESGPSARPFDIEWARSAITKCRDSGGYAFVKQLGKWIAADAYPDRSPGVLCAQQWLFPNGDRWTPPLIGPNAFARPDGATAFTLADRKGGDMREWPEDLRVREMPRNARREGA